MELNLNNVKDNRIFIIEGIAGSGKDTIQKELSDHFNSKNMLVYDFSEEELLFSWKHYWIDDMEQIRLDYLNSIIDYCEKLINKDKRNIIILNRFHISYLIFSRYPDKTNVQYTKLIKRLKTLPIHVFVGKLNHDKMEKRAMHYERKEEIFRIHQQNRLKESKYDSFLDLYKNEQKFIFETAEKQNILYSFFEL